VTPFIKNSGLFNCEWIRTNEKYHYKLSVDTLEDLRLAQAIFDSFDNDIEFGMNEVAALLESKPELLAINKGSIINSGYAKSLREDKKIK